MRALLAALLVFTNSPALADQENIQEYCSCAVLSEREAVSDYNDRCATGTGSLEEQARRPDDFASPSVLTLNFALNPKGISTNESSSYRKPLVG